MFYGLDADTVYLLDQFYGVPTSNFGFSFDNPNAVCFYVGSKQDRSLGEVPVYLAFDFDSITDRGLTTKFFDDELIPSQVRTPKYTGSCLIWRLRPHKGNSPVKKNQVILGIRTAPTLTYAVDAFVGDSVKHYIHTVLGSGVICGCDICEAADCVVTCSSIPSDYNIYELQGVRVVGRGYTNRVTPTERVLQFSGKTGNTINVTPSRVERLVDLCAPCY